ncbi:MAG: helix-turn-helix transcriptional regulator [Flavobacteriales bacterium]
MPTIKPVSFRKQQGPAFELEVTTREALRKRGLEDELGKPSRPDFHIIFHITKGRGTHTIDFKRYPVEPGSTLFVCKGQVHIFDTRSKMEGVLVLLTDAFLQKHGAHSVALADGRLFNYHLYSPLVDAKSARAEQLRDLFQGMLGEYKGPEGRKEEVLHHLLQLVLLKADRAKGFSLNDRITGRVYNDFLRFKNLVETNYTRTRRAEDYAERMGRSLKRLNELCRAATGQTVKAYVDARTVLEIRRHMSVRDKSVKEIAFALGFDEPTNLVKYVKRLTGRTPGELF